MDNGDDGNGDGDGDDDDGDDDDHDDDDSDSDDDDDDDDDNDDDDDDNDGKQHKKINLSWEVAVPTMVCIFVSGVHMSSNFMRSSVANVDFATVTKSLWCGKKSMSTKSWVQD